MSNVDNQASSASSYLYSVDRLHQPMTLQMSLSLNRGSGLNSKMTLTVFIIVLSGQPYFFRGFVLLCH